MDQPPAPSHKGPPNPALTIKAEDDVAKGRFANVSHVANAADFAWEAAKQTLRMFRAPRVQGEDALVTDDAMRPFI